MISWARSISPGIDGIVSAGGEEERRLLTCRVLAGVLLVATLAGPVAQAQDSRAQSEVKLRELEQKLCSLYRHSGGRGGKWLVVASQATPVKESIR
jgi:hypothetical protein